MGACMSAQCWGVAGMLAAERAWHQHLCPGCLAAHSLEIPPCKGAWGKGWTFTDTGSLRMHIPLGPSGSLSPPLASAAPEPITIALSQGWPLRGATPGPCCSCLPIAPRILTLASTAARQANARIWSAHPAPSEPPFHLAPHPDCSWLPEVVPSTPLDTALYLPASLASKQQQR